jgi:hypothetical protein
MIEAQGPNMPKTAHSHAGQFHRGSRAAQHKNAMWQIALAFAHVQWRGAQQSQKNNRTGHGKLNNAIPNLR